MIKRLATFFSILFFISFSASFRQKTSIAPIELTIEYLANPSGLDIIKPRFSWKLSSINENEFGQRQTAYRILVSDNKKLLKKNIGNLWDSEWILSDNTQLIEYGGNKLNSDKTYFWKVQVKDEKDSKSAFSKIAEWDTGLFKQDEWTAKWIGTSEYYDPIEGSNKMKDPWFRKTFTLSEKPIKANIFVASVGYHEIYVNGQRIDEHVLAPATTDHTKRARYISYDITPTLKSGENVISLWLGTSWSIYAPYATSDKPRTPLVIAQSDIYGKNNKLLTRISTDQSWKTHPSPNQLIGNWGFGVGGYGGEIYDANKEINNWNTTLIDDSSWNDATVYTPSLKLSAQKVETNKKFEEIRPLSIDELPDGSYKVNMGVNFAGWMQVSIKGDPEDKIDFYISEREKDEMTFGLHNSYIIGASGEGTFQNRFNYISGQWITIKGLKYKPNINDIKGWMVRTNFKNASNFTSSDTLQNWIYNTVKWTFENLSLGGYIVDCPQRERFGYGGDAHATSETGFYNYQLGAFYNKWLEDWRDVQGTEPMVGNMNNPKWARKHEGSGRHIGGGILPQTAPTYHGGGGTAWGGIVVTLPWFMYQYQGDKRALEENFEMIKGWLDFLDSHVENNMLKRYGGEWDFLGDWLWPGATSQGMNNYSDETLFFNNCYRVYNLKTAAKIARVIDKEDIAELWEQKAQLSSDAIHEKYYHADIANYSDNSMRSLAAALYGDIMPIDIRPKVIKSLEKEILINKNGHIDVGITGGAMLFKVLRDEGRDDLIYSMMSKTTYPSWGLMKEKGATTIWEMWEHNLPGHSLLHSSYLYPGAWYIDGLAGIRLREDSPGFKKVNIRIPNIYDKVSAAKATFDSPIGIIKTSWEKTDDSLKLDVVIPPNGEAIVNFPKYNNKSVNVNSKHAKLINECDNYYTFEIKSGKYHFNN